MTRQINLSHLRQSNERVKQYIDSQANAQVIRTETIIVPMASGDDGAIDFANSSPTNTRTGSDGVQTYWGQSGTNFTVNNLEDYDELEIVVFGNDTSGTVVDTIYVPMSSLKIVGQAATYYPIQWTSAFCSRNDINFYVYFGVGIQGNNKLAFGDWGRGSATTAAGIWYVKGIKYTVPETYSTAEQIVGTWIDGRPIYQKTISVGNVPANQQTTVQFGVTVDNLIEAYGHAGAFPFPAAYTVNPNYSVTFQGQTSTSIGIRTGSAASLTNAYLTIKYTKA